MAAPDTTPAAEPVAEDPSSALVLPPEAAVTWEAMFANVPESDDDGLAAIVAQLTAARDAGDLDAPWRSEGIAPHVDRPLRITAIRKRPSDYVGGLPWFLVVDAIDRSTGEALTITTGAVSVVAQLVRAHALGVLPLDVVPRASKRATRRGYHPVHLEVDR